MSAGPDKPSLMFVALGWDPRKYQKDWATPAGAEKDAEVPLVEVIPSGAVAMTKKSRRVL